MPRLPWWVNDYVERLLRPEKFKEAKGSAAQCAALLRTFRVSNMRARAIYRAYRKMIGRLGNGAKDVKVRDLVNYFRISERNKFAAKCLLPLQRTKGNPLQFDVFLMFVINSCASNDAALKNFAFSVYSEGKGFLTSSDVLGVCLDAYNLQNTRRTSMVQNSKEFKRKRLETLIQSMSFPSPDGTTQIFDFRNFLAFTQRNSLFLFPAFKLQQAIRSRVCGAPFWSGVKIRDARKGSLSAEADADVAIVVGGK